MDNELQHYGVLGMKWGRRKQRPRSEDSERVKQIRKKKIHEMSNQELQDVNKRLNLEKNYKDLTKKKSRIKTAVNVFTTAAATIAAVSVAADQYKKYCGPVCNTMLDKIGDWVVKDIKLDSWG